ncbi:hypothetical protein PRIP_12824 [Listeria riparia FSL S10-1204]|uniref:MBL fold metallo-hydrolase n=1 Tax=Listeria riparia FSL S10-1204 TaxID=1265816 RepID=W7D2J3_9LIST|nr:hypothetical protein PRIP_12824 [Listeria riparia FSL S10-1204]
MDTLQVGEIKIHWLRGGIAHFDGGAMFGVVPKALWQKKYEPNEKNQIRCTTDPMYFEYQGKHYLIDAGIGVGRLTEKTTPEFRCNRRILCVGRFGEIKRRPRSN